MELFLELLTPFRDEPKNLRILNGDIMTCDFLLREGSCGIWQFPPYFVLSIGSYFLTILCFVRNRVHNKLFWFIIF